MTCFSRSKIRTAAILFFMCMMMVCFYTFTSAYAVPPTVTAQDEVAPADSTDKKESPDEGRQTDEGTRGECGTCTWEFKKEEYTEEGPFAIKRERIVFYLRPTKGTSGELGTWEKPPWTPFDADYVSRHSDDGERTYVEHTLRGVAERIVIEGKIKAQTCVGMFAYFTSVREVENLSNLDTAGVTSMSGMFFRCYKLQKLDVGRLNTSAVLNISRMFWECVNLTSLTGIEGWNTANATDMEAAFGRCCSLTSLDLSQWKTTKVTKMSFMFKYCYSLTSIGDVSGWDTGAVKSMSEMFAGCSELGSSTEPASAKPPSNDLAQHLSKWNVGAVKDMSGMFQGCHKFKKLDLNEWNVEAVNNMSEMFKSCDALEELAVNKWNVRAVEKMAGMFRSCAVKTLDLSGWDVKAVEDMSDMFAFCRELTSLNLSTWDTITARGSASDTASDDSELTCQVKTAGMFSGTSLLKTILLGNKFLIADDAGFSSDDAYSGSADVSAQTKAGETREYWMHVEGGTDDKPTGKYFASPSVFAAFHNDVVRNGADNQDSRFEKYVKVSRKEKVELENTKGFFGGCEWEYVSKDREGGEKTYTLYIRPVESKSNAGLLGNWTKDRKDPKEKSNPPWAGRLFSEYRLRTTNLVIEKSKTGILVKIATGEGMFEDFKTLSAVDVSGLDTKGASNISRMFAGCSSLTALDVKNLDVSSVTNMSSMFKDCRGLATIRFASDDGLQHWDTSLVRDMSSMFEGCSSLTQVDGIQYWNTAAVETMRSMFACCYSLPSFNLSNWKTSSKIQMRDMFSGAWSIKAICLGHGFKIKPEAGLFEVGQRFDNQWIQVKDGTQTSPKGTVFASVYDLISFHNAGRGANPEWYVKWSIQGAYGQYVWEYAPSGEKDPNGRVIYLLIVRPLEGAPERLQRNIPEWKSRGLPPWDPEYSKCHSSTTKIVFEGDVKIGVTASGAEEAIEEDKFVKSVFAEGSFNFLENLDSIDVANLNIEDEDDDGVADIGSILKGSSKVTHIRVNSDFEFGEPSGTSAKSLRFVDENGKATGVKWAYVDPAKDGTKEDPKGEVFDTFEKLSDFQAKIKNKAKRSGRAKRSTEESAEERTKKPVEYVQVSSPATSTDNKEETNLPADDKDDAGGSAPEQNDSSADGEDNKVTNEPEQTDNAADGEDNKVTNEPEQTDNAADGEDNKVTNEPEQTDNAADGKDDKATNEPEQTDNAADGKDDKATNEPEQTDSSADDKDNKATNNVPEQNSSSVPNEDKVTVNRVDEVGVLAGTRSKIADRATVIRAFAGGKMKTAVDKVKQISVSASDKGSVTASRVERASASPAPKPAPASKNPVGWHKIVKDGQTKWSYHGLTGNTKLVGRHELVGGKDGGKHWFCFDENGFQIRGWNLTGNTWYYYSEEDGAMLKGQHKLVGGKNGSENWFYFDEVTGIQVRGWKYIDSQKKWCYYSTDDGAMLKGQHKLAGGKNGSENWFYFDEVTGAQVRGWKYIDSQKKWCYYSTEDGVMLKGQHELVGGENGGKNWFYFDEVTGEELRNCWKEIPSQGKTCYYGPDGAMYKGLRVIDGREYYFNEETGAVQ